MPVPIASAPSHAVLANNLVHVFVDDQNLFWGVVNRKGDRGYRIDFGSLLVVAARGAHGKGRGCRTAYIAGVIPDDDSFWQIAEDQGFKVLRGFLGTNNRSKQDDAFLVAEMVATLYEQEGPSTIVLVAGDADYGPALKKAVEKGWRVEVLTEPSQGLSMALGPYVHQFRSLTAAEIQKR